MGRNSKQHHRRQRAAASVTAGAGMTAYQGASHSDLALRDWQPLAGSPDGDLLPELDTLTNRSRDLARNDGLMAGGIQTHRDNIVGAVLRLSALPDYRLLGWTAEQAREWGNKVANAPGIAEGSTGLRINGQACTVNCPGFSLSVEGEKAPHYSSQGGPA